MATNRHSNPEAENDLLTSIPGMEDYNELGSQDDTGLGNDEVQGGETGTGEDGAASGSGDNGQDGAGETDPNAVRTPADGQQQQQDGQPRYDKNGNVIDAKGNIIAPAGRFRRIDEENKRLKAYATTQGQELARLKGQMAEMQFLNGQPAKLGLTNEEAAIGLDIMAMFKGNPEQAVTLVLSEAAARGVDLNKVLGQSRNIDTQAISRMLDQRLGPVLQERQERQRNAEVEREATLRYNRFLASYPDAVHHQDAIARLMAEQGVTEDVAYLKLETFALRNGLDITQPFGPQIAARQQQGDGQQRQQQRPMPNGRPVGRQAVQRDTKVASPDRSFASIVDEALAEAGIRE